MATDPSEGIDDKLLPHVHLISTNHYADNARVDVAQVTKWLLAAPQVAKDKAPFFWTYLDRPRDGQIYLTWQPLKRQGLRFSSDGMVWAPPEQCHRQDMGNGLILEIYYHKSGFAPGEQNTMHARRRFRLVPSPNGNASSPQPDVSLWIVHYGPADSKDMIPVSKIILPEETGNIVNTRNYLQTAGQIHRKPFMLSDRVNWPTIMWPRTGARAGLQNISNTHRNIPQALAYPTAGPQGGRRGRQHQVTQAQMLAMQNEAARHLQSDLVFEEEDAQADLFDNLTPRDISIARYQQNHEWMEEILSSPYAINQITAPDLNLGLKGDLASLTEGIFTAQGADDWSKAPKKPYIGRLDNGLADEFKKRVQEYIDSTNLEMDAMKVEHAKTLANIKATSYMTHAEKDVRNSVAETSSDFWRLEGRSEETEESGSSWPQKHHKTVDEVVAQVESQLGRHVEVLHNIHRVQDGGYQQPAPEPIPEPVIEPVSEPVVQTPEATPTAVDAAPSAALSRRPSQAGSPHSGVLVDDSDIDMGGTAAGLLDQMHTGFSSTSTPLNNFPTPQPHLSAINSTAATPANFNIPSPGPAPPTIPEEPEESNAGAQDVSMGNTGAPTTAGTAPDQGTGSEDWVVVPKGGVSPDPTVPSATATADAGNSDVPKPAAAATKLSPAAGTPAVTDGGSIAFDGDQNDFSSLGDLDTAGDALAGYDEPALDGEVGELGDGLDLHMDMEDSAFGDAFHGVGATDTPGENQSEGV